MDVSSTQLTNYLKAVQGAFNYTFEEGSNFCWSAGMGTVFFKPPQQQEDIWDLLHEVAHAELGHTDYGLDIELVSQERQAWDLAANKLAAHFGLDIQQTYIEEQLDTYRLWMFERSRCPNCGQNGLQTKNTYSCINCRCFWRANEARLCSLRRIRLQGQGQTS